ncbi:MAG: hypothetical protein CVU17_07680 [Betaproteobacteria bacterium HGW-Betaproteobacteria-11]|nr:MAG: hypothetical protein CVU17_07680 [Betaproteobacteria bacterium HGW-Betaproteobacteria-11]
MKPRHILFFDGSRLAIHAWKDGRVHPEGHFAADAAGLENFDNWLGQHRGSLLYLLADVAEEGFQVEDIPWVQGGDRIALIKRRLGQHFYGTPLAVGLSLGRASEGRRDEKMLLAALTHAEAFAPWIEAIHRARAILAGIWSIPLVLAECGPRWIKSSDPALLVTLTAGGVRQTFFDAGKLRFSRLTPLATRSQNEMARVIGNESFNTWQYLVGQRQIRRGAAVRVIVLASAAQVSGIRQHCPQQEELAYEFLDLATTAQAEGLKSLQPADTADELIVHVLAKRPPRLQFARSKERHFYRLWQIRFALTSAAAIILAGGLLFALKNWSDSRTLAEQTATAEAGTKLATQRYAALLASLPKVDVTPDNLRLLTGLLDELQQQSPLLEPLLIQLASALNDMPRIELVSLDWKIGPRPQGPQKVGAGGTPPLPAIAATAASGGVWSVLEVQAQLPLGLSSDLRAQKEIIDAFAERLKDPQTTVQIIAMPFDVESAKPLKSHDETSGNRTSGAPRFTLQIARPL